jgi:hypothetical protein
VDIVKDNLSRIEGPIYHDWWPIFPWGGKPVLGSVSFRAGNKYMVITAGTWDHQAFSGYLTLATRYMKRVRLTKKVIGQVFPYEIPILFIVQNTAFKDVCVSPPEPLATCISKGNKAVGR